MKVKNTFLATILIVLTSIFLSSCETDYHYGWEKAFIHRTIEVETRSGGVFSGVYDIDVNEDIYDMNERPMGRYVEDLTYQGGDIRIYADQPMEVLTLVVYGGRNESVSIDLPFINGGNKENIFDSSVTADFLYDVSLLLREYGYVEVKYYGESVYAGRSTMEIDIYMDVNAYVRY